jgi:hypothetical protein
MFICVGEFMHPVPCTYRHSFSNRTETELECNTGFTEHITLAFCHIQTVGSQSILVLIYYATVCMFG